MKAEGFPSYINLTEFFLLLENAISSEISSAEIKAATVKPKSHEELERAFWEIFDIIANTVRNEFRNFVNEEILRIFILGLEDEAKRILSALSVIDERDSKKGFDCFSQAHPLSG